MEASITRLNRLLGLLVVGPMLVYVFSGPTFLGYDGNIMLRVTESLLFRHSVQITDPMLHFNEPYSNYGLGLSLLIAPMVALGHLVAGSSTALLSLFQPLVTAATVATLWLLLREFGIGGRRALWIAWLFAFGTLAWHYAGVLFSEPLITLCVTVALLGLLRFRRTARLSDALLAGAATGIAVVTRVDSVLLVLLPVAAYFLAVVARPERQRAPEGAMPSDWPRVAMRVVVFVLPIVIGSAIDLWYNWARYGSPLHAGYSAEGVAFSYPLLKGLYGLLLSPGAGLLVFVPVLVMALIGFPGLSRRWPMEAALVAAIIAVRVVFYAGWFAWDGGVTWGPRYLIPVVPLLMVGLGFLPMRGWRALLTWITGAASVGIQLLGQMVWFITWFGSATAELAPRTGLPQCGTCGSSTIVALERLKEIMDFDWHYSPLIGQLRLLLEGAAHPAWAPIAWLVPFLVLGIAACGWYQWRLAGSEGPSPVRISEAA